MTCCCCDFYSPKAKAKEKYVEDPRKPSVDQNIGLQGDSVNNTITYPLVSYIYNNYYREKGFQ